MENVGFRTQNHGFLLAKRARNAGHVGKVTTPTEWENVFGPTNNPGSTAHAHAAVNIPMSREKNETRNLPQM